MNEPSDEILRPPMGFVVEGHGEFNCYPSLVHRIVGAHGFKIPRVNAGGYGNIVRNLGDQLRALVLAEHPAAIIVSVDLREVIRDDICATCAELVTALRQQVQDWQVEAIADDRMIPMPSGISIVIQIQQFESWVVADLQSLLMSGYSLPHQPNFTNVDVEVPNPAAVLRDQIDPAIDLKNPTIAKSVFTQLDVDTMRHFSPSFDKFYREVLASYGDWVEASGFA